MRPGARIEDSRRGDHEGIGDAIPAEIGSERPTRREAELIRPVSRGSELAEDLPVAAHVVGWFKQGNREGRDAIAPICQLYKKRWFTQ